jgi:signal transduction histidine kinase
LLSTLTAGGPEIDVHATGRLDELPAAVEVAAYRIAAEAVTNAVRHAGATRVEVRLHRGEHDLVVEVADDGRGLEGAAVPETGGADGTGLGLASMHTRAEELGGALTVAGGPASGTCLRAELPLVPARAAVGS